MEEVTHSKFFELDPDPSPFSGRWIAPRVAMIASGQEPEVVPRDAAQRVLQAFVE